MKLLLAIAVFAAFVLAGSEFARADAKSDALSAEARQVLVDVYSANPKFAVLGKQAHAVLVFPRIKKSELTARPFTSFDGGYGEGVLVRQGAADGFYNFVSDDWGRAGSDAPFALIVFLMTPAAEQNVTLDGAQTARLAGHDLPATPSKDTYVLAFDAQGPIDRLSLNDSKVARMRR